MTNSERNYKTIFAKIILLFLCLVLVAFVFYLKYQAKTNQAKEFATSAQPHQTLVWPTNNEANNEVNNAVNNSVEIKKDSPEKSTAPSDQPNYYLQYLATKLLLLVTQGDDFSEIIIEFNKINNKALLNDKIKEISSLANKNTSLLQLLNELVQLNLAPQTVTFSSNNGVVAFIFNNKLLDKLFVVKKIDPKAQQQLALVRKYLSNNQLDLAIVSASEIEHQALQDWLIKAQDTQKVHHMAQEIYQYVKD